MFFLLHFTTFRTWSTGRNINDGWPDHTNDSENKDWSVGHPSAATAYTDLVQEFEPGKPWKVKILYQKREMEFKSQTTTFTSLHKPNQPTNFLLIIILYTHICILLPPLLLRLVSLNNFFPKGFPYRSIHFTTICYTHNVCHVRLLFYFSEQTIQCRGIQKKRKKESSYIFVKKRDSKTRNWFHFLVFREFVCIRYLI